MTRSAGLAFVETFLSVFRLKDGQNKTKETVMTSSSGQTIEAFLNAFRLKDVDAAMAKISDQVKVTIFPMKVQNAGKTVVASLLNDIVTAFPDLLITVHHLTTVGKVVVAEFKLEGTQAADFLGAINQEKHLDLDTAWRFTVEGDQVVALEAYWCQNQLYRRLAIKRQDEVAIV